MNKNKKLLDMYRGMKRRKQIEHFVRIVLEKKKKELNKRVKIIVDLYEL